MNRDQVEQDIQAAGLSAARVTPAEIEAAIASEWYFTAGRGVDAELGLSGMGDQYPKSLDMLTMCVLVLRNGFTVVGHSACAHPSNFNAELGRSVARRNAVDQMWSLLGYMLREQIHTGQIA